MEPLLVERAEGGNHTIMTYLVVMELETLHQEEQPLDVEGAGAAILVGPTEAVKLAAPA